MVWCFFSKVDGWPCAHRARAGSKKVPTLLFEGCRVFSRFSHCIITWLFWCWFWWGHGRCRVKNACLFLTCNSEFNRGFRSFRSFHFFATFSQHFDVSTHRLFDLRINTIMTCVFITSSESCTFRQGSAPMLHLPFARRFACARWHAWYSKVILHFHGQGDANIASNLWCLGLQLPKRSIYISYLYRLQCQYSWKLRL